MIDYEWKCRQPTDDELKLFDSHPVSIEPLPGGGIRWRFVEPKEGEWTQSRMTVGNTGVIPNEE
jgi:hypothetical protein